jgi:hypothetical protein
MRALTIISRKQPMTLKFFVTVSVLAAAPIVALAQQDFNSKTWVPTIGDAQKLVETISSDKDKLKAYCEIGKLDEQLDKVEKRGDETEFEALVAKRDTLEQQLGPNYIRVIDGLRGVEPNSAEDQKFSAVFEPLHKHCK